MAMTTPQRSIKVAYHLVDIRNWSSIQEHGLHSTRSLVEMSAGQRSVLREHRPQGIQLPGGIYIRDQSPMPVPSLQRALRSGVTPGDWFELLNSKVFFWLDIERLNRHRHACRRGKQVVLALDVGRLMDGYSHVASVSPINLGNAMRAAAPRNYTTLVPYEKWVESGWDSIDVPGASRRPRSHRPAELMIAGAIPDVGKFVIGTVYLDQDEMLTERHIATEDGMGSA